MFTRKSKKVCKSVCKSQNVCPAANFQQLVVRYNIFSVKYVSGQFSAKQESSISVITLSGSVRSNQANNGNIIAGVMTLFTLNSKAVMYSAVMYIT